MAGWRLFGEITKAEPQDDGTLLVEGIASSETPDSAGDVITAEAVQAALPDYLQFPAIREMHRADSAAGTGLNIEVGEDRMTRIQALIVDPVAIKKVETGTYRGFSIGGSIPKDGGRDPKNKKIVRKIRLTEVSLVDRPANPDAQFTLVKCDQPNPMEDEDMDKTDDAPGTGATPEHEPLAKWAGEEITDAMRAIQCLDSLFWLFTKETAEGESTQAADLKTVCDKLRAFIAAEILERNPDNPGVDALAMGEGAAKAEAGAPGEEPLAKAGAKYSKATKDALANLRKAIGDAQECMKAFDDADTDKEGEGEEGAEKGDQSEALQKAEGARDEALAKFESLQAEHEELKKTYAALKAEIAKKPLRAVPVGKADDTAVTAEEEPLKKADTTPTDPLEAMRKVHAHGARPVSSHYNPNPFNRLG